MEEIAARIKELIADQGLSNKDFAQSIDVAPAIISHVLSGRNNPSLHLIQQITNVYTNVNLDYLLNGKGSMYEDQQLKDYKANEPKVPIDPKEPKEVDKAKQVSSEDEAAYSSFGLPPGARYVSEPSGAPIPYAVKDTIDNPKTEPTDKQEPEYPKEKRDSELTNVYTNVNPVPEKEIDRIIIFYRDRSFREYRPEA
ncbi:helix-turn-helix domain-containing protein [Croceimicrobium hydrocarbonivorans]|uniref:Helix-turn-helix transcriptional regulator n=1 Tax=Croceimicrobium hydrocarbonivorans TaxID=2761580 RepID=A0A7H0VEK0_9FLAO|nr:helix-turn-helix transcriptional regulator [Croceimicrobium hydrocarbonivorans]QNR24148.1 helix-turn-helix transcriptional regulator [Croceimicrobium hydrocarbonivorans]